MATSSTETKKTFNFGLNCRIYGKDKVKLEEIAIRIQESIYELEKTDGIDVQYMTVDFHG